MNNITVLGIKFDKITLYKTLEKAKSFLSSQKQHFIVTPNPEIVLKCQKDNGFKEIINSADLSIPDGIGIVWASFVTRNCHFERSATKSRNLIRKFSKMLIIITRTIIFILLYIFYKKPLKKILPERVTGLDLMIEICKNLKEKVFLLGAGEGIAEIAKEKMEKQNYKANIVGTFSGNPKDESSEQIIKLINQSGANILFIAFGAPAQEKWIYKHLSKMPKIKIAMGVGGSFDFISGKIPRSPMFLREIGCEWLWRFYKEPWRYKRMYNALIRFPLAIIKQTKKLKNKI